MKEKIIDYLTLLILRDKGFQSYPNQRIKSAYILARKAYSTLTDQKKEKIVEVIKKNNN